MRKKKKERGRDGGREWGEKGPVMKSTNKGGEE